MQVFNSFQEMAAGQAVGAHGIMSMFNGEAVEKAISAIYHPMAKLEGFHSLSMEDELKYSNQLNTAIDALKVACAQEGIDCSPEGLKPSLEKLDMVEGKVGRNFRMYVFDDYSDD